VRGDSHAGFYESRGAQLPPATHLSLVFVAVVGLVALLGILATLPSLALPPAVPLRARFALLGNRRVLAIVGVMLLASAASISVYTYVAVVLAHTAHITGTTLAAVLLVWGAGGAVGAFGSGALTDRYGPGRTLLLAETWPTSCPIILPRR